jgi:hypothetical protein
MKKLMLTACLVLGLVIMVAPMAMADQVQIGYPGSSYGMYQAGSGGEFTVKPIGWDPLPLYDNKAKNIGVAGTFQTFCVETGETINGYPATYDVVLNDNAVYGGIGAGGDPLSKGAAWLYHQFQLGNLDGYNYSGTEAQREATALALQAAIWKFEDEGGSINPFYTAAVTHFSTIGENALDNNFDIGTGTREIPVMVMNLTLNGDRHQDLLVCVPVPEPGILILLGIAMSAIGAASWRIRKL